MRLIVNITLTLLSYQILSFCSSESTTEINESDDVSSEQGKLSFIITYFHWAIIF